MYITQTNSGDRIEVVIEPMAEKDYKSITKSNFPKFNWKLEKDNTVLKLMSVESENIFGLVSLKYFKDEQYIKINLIQSSKESIGRNKKYDRIAGCLISYACRLSFIEGYGGCVALQPKTIIAKHYMDKYGFKLGGQHLYVELMDSEKLISEYLS